MLQLTRYTTADSVTALAFSSCHSDSVLWAGSVDGNIYTIDLRIAQSELHTNACLGSVHYGNSAIVSLALDEENTQKTLYVTSERGIEAIDCRRWPNTNTMGKIQIKVRLSKEKTKGGKNLTQSFDDIIACSTLMPKNKNAGTRERTVAIGTDSGTLYQAVHTNASQSNKEEIHITQCMDNAHDNIIMAVAPGDISGRTIVTGGMDCMIRWRRTYDGHLMHTINVNNSDGQFTNPPFVNYIAVNHQKNLLAAALGNGSILLHDLMTPFRKKQAPLSLLRCSHAPLNCVEFLPTSTAQATMLVTSATQQVAVWSLNDSDHLAEYVSWKAESKWRTTTGFAHTSAIETLHAEHLRAAFNTPKINSILPLSLTSIAVASVENDVYVYDLCTA